MSEDLKNICFHKQRQLWFVKIQKQRHIFEAYTESKEEAIQLRDKVRKFMKEHGRPPEFDEVGHQPQKRKVEPKPKTVYIMTCVKCNRVTKSTNPITFDGFEKSGHICGRCRIGNAVKQRFEQDALEDDQSSMRNISYHKKSGSYTVRIIRSGKKFTCSAETLEEARKIKKSVLEFVKANGRVPTIQESTEMLGLKSNEDRYLNLSTGERHISADRTDDTFIVQIVKDGQKFSMRVKSLEHAKILRDEVYVYYQTHSMLPKSSDFIDRRNELDAIYFKAKNPNAVIEQKERYISSRNKNSAWFIRFIRDNKVFTAYDKDLNEAIKIRDRALQYYEKHGVIPKRSQVGAGDDVELTKVPVIVQCSSCKRKYSFSRRGVGLGRFRANQNICTQCQLFDYASNSGDVEYITQKSRSQSFTIQFTKKNQIVSISETSFTEAVKIRDNILYFYYDHDRLPSQDELESIVGRKLDIVKSKNRANKTDRSKLSDNRYISKSYQTVNSDKAFYNVTFSRNNRRFLASTGSFQEALEVRNTALDLYDETGEIPTFQEVKERIQNGK